MVLETPRVIRAKDQLTSFFSAVVFRQLERISAVKINIPTKRLQELGSLTSVYL